MERAVIRQDKCPQTPKAIPHRSFTQVSNGSHVTDTPQIQYKLHIGQPNDRYEREADRMADHVMRMPKGNGVQTACPSCEPEELQAKRLFPVITPLIQRQAEEEEEEIQSKPSTAGAIPDASPGFVSTLHSSKGTGSPLPASVKTFMEGAFHSDFSGVRIHNDSRSAFMNKTLQAKAFTSGSDIYFNRGQYSPETYRGKRLLGHELTHVVQQGGSTTGVLQRAPQEVAIPDGKRTCKAKIDSRIIEKSEPVRTDFDIDTKNITLSIRWCKGQNLGDIKFGANLPEQAMKVVKDIFDVIKSGGDSGQIKEKLRNTDITPFLEVVIKQGGAFSITARGEITVDSSGVKGGKGSIDLNFGPVIISPHIEGQKEGGVKPGLDIKIPLPLGSGEVEKVKCKTQKLRIGKFLSCHCPTPSYSVPGPVDVPYPIWDKFIYFHYNTSNINKAYSENSIEEIRKLLGMGYRVSNITGYTSPEGTFVPSPGFMGNKKLAEKRAEEARRLIESLCSPLNMRSAISCNANVLKKVEKVGKGELLSSDEKGALLTDKKGKELEGKELATEAVGQFEKSKKEQEHLKVLSAEEKARLAKARTPEQKAELIYPLLRRVKLTLVKSGMQKTLIQIEMPAGQEPCPAKVKEQARNLLPFIIP